MPIGTRHELEGLLLETAHGELVLRIDDGGTWRLAQDRRARQLIGLRVQVRGERIGFDLLSVEQIVQAPAGGTVRSIP